jgi:hypothetical protein
MINYLFFHSNVYSNIIIKLPCTTDVKSMGEGWLYKLN